MEYQVDGWNNFCRVFLLPESYPSEFCFAGGHPVTFQMVDWFNPIPGVGQAAVSKEVWRQKVGEIEVKTVTDKWLHDKLVPWLSEKKYVLPGREYLVLCNFGAAIRFQGRSDRLHDAQEEH
jgi:hypothetical protein